MAHSQSRLSLPSSNSGPNLRPRSPTGPKPGYIVQSPDSRISVRRPSSEQVLPNPDCDFDASINGSDSSVVEVPQAKESLKEVLKTKNKKKQKNKSGSKVKVRPRGSGASASLPQGPSKKQKKATVPVRLSLFGYLLSFGLEPMLLRY